MNFLKRISPVFLISAITSLAFVLATTNIREDDSYIYLVYARNIAEGYGYVFNRGEYVNGATSALFPILIAMVSPFFAWVEADRYLFAMRFIQWMSLTAICFSCSQLLKRIRFNYAPVFFPMAFLATGILGIAVGMESFLVMAFGLTALVAYEQGRLCRTAILLALAMLARPDAGILALLVTAHYVLTERKLPPIRCGIIFAATLLPWILFSFWSFGSPLPQTLGAKMAQAATGWWGKGDLFGKGFGNAFEKKGLFLLCAMFLSFAVTIRRAPLLSTSLVLAFSWVVLYLLIYTLVLKVPGYPWYYTPVAIPIGLIISMGADSAVELTPPPSKALLSAIVVVLLLGAFTSELQIRSRAHVTKKYVVYRALAEWLNTNAEDGASVAMSEVGVLGYYYKKGAVIDPLGLITKGAAENIRKKNYGWFMDRFKPSYIVFADPPRAMESIVNTAPFKKRYGLIHHFQGQKSSLNIYKRISS